VQFVEPSVGRRRLGSCSPIFGSDGKLVGAIHIAMDVATPAPPDVVVTKDLSRQQKQILKLLCCGRTAKGIAAQLGISPRTVEYHKHRMMQKLSVRSLAELITHVLTQNPAHIK
jgi:DNA-binding NarL/FixJ family response regulator